jgi:hypothetical protein
MTEPETSFSDRLGRPDRRRIVPVAGALVIVALTAAVAMGASPTPSTAVPAASTAPGASTAPKEPNGVHDGLGFRGGFDGPFRGGGPGFGGITITAINGSSLSLKTADGWTRTIEITASTELTKGGDTIAAGDLAVGDAIRFRQERQADGTFTITAIQVVLPTTAGTVTAVGTNSITVEQRDGTTATIHVDGGTTFNVAGNADAKIGDVTVGMRIVAEGERNADGSLDATRVGAGNGRGPGHWEGAKPGAPNDDPAATPAPTSNPG